ncbi:MAG: hypothetical protein LPK19_13500, partial [Hymenobacteraceae bacterium]|nr:hypothetical protein [Hymenobacteraceae bacterium]MDX5397243.1 hypothetical protein [Hymenobacteraceae bacterium]MDX5513319.1 hypothetical protein [Hymenobacteraceae bacterium]
AEGNLKNSKKEYRLRETQTDTSTLIQDYRAHLKFGNKKVLAMIDNILLNATRPTVIFLQGDHGPTLNPEFTNFRQQDYCERFAILNAIYFSTGNYKNLYPSVSPVNNIPILFNTYFKSNLQLQPDSSYFTDLQQPYWFTNITDTLKNCTTYSE